MMTFLTQQIQNWKNEWALHVEGIDKDINLETQWDHYSYWMIEVGIYLIVV